MARLVIEDLEVRYGDFVAVEGINLTVEDGEFCVFLGPSGCGKTSTLRVVAGLIKPYSGRVVIDDEVINDLYPGERDIGMVFQSYALYPHMTVADHFAFPLKAQKMPKAAIHEKIQHMGELLNLADVLDRRPADISIGQAQRVAIGRALIREPRLLLLDEPLNNLDLQLSLRTRAVLKRLQRDLGITTIYVTHDQEEAQSLADEIVVMNMGHIQQIGSPREIYDEPMNDFVAGFIGTPPMNFIRCHVEASNGSVQLVNQNGFSLKANPDLLNTYSYLADGTQTTLGIRPERLALAREPNPDLPKGFVHTIEPEGNEAIISVRVGEDLIWKVRADKAGEFAVDMPVYLNIDQSKMHLFAPDSGDRLGKVR